MTIFFILFAIAWSAVLMLAILLILDVRKHGW